MRNLAATSVLLAAALGGAVATAGPAGAAAEAVHYTATDTESSMIIHTDAGALRVRDGVFRIEAADGTVLAGAELSFRVDDFVFPIAADISGRTATLTPRFEPAHATYRPIALPYENQAPWKSEYEREQAAWNRMATTISTGATIGTLVGGITGAGVGCLLGGATGAVLTGALSAMFGALPGAIAGCIAGLSVIGFLGTLAGQLFITAPVAILAAAQYFTTINSPLQGR
ncbi:hypothetical protein LTV02_14285 [Nocardia yamanashiensis]|uniref:hypothetical protein n=1 Tax=Nocardia yamanashiensis TaxID=209247 RepID=UPI001E5D4F80|nr:hypothetical protein [Nocardia yamanashiensis]UGT44482.1 hypothetical protein LTV02_14285 [Nocardia yamanashiensis]